MNKSKKWWMLGIAALVAVVLVVAPWAIVYLLSLALVVWLALKRNRGLDMQGLERAVKWDLARDIRGLERAVREEDQEQLMEEVNQFGSGICGSGIGISHGIQIRSSISG